jgi:hypothetical protein
MHATRNFINTSQKCRPAANRLSARGCLFLLLSLVLCTMMAGMARAQSERGNLNGTVTDSTGAVIGKATVIVTDLSTGERTKVDTTKSGDYSASNLPPGRYSLEVQAPGFRGYLQKGIVLSVAVTTRQDVRLSVGDVTDVITVTTDASMLKTDNAEQSTTISRDEIDKLPIPFTQTAAIRDPMAFVKLVPGSYVTPGSNTAIRVNGLPSASFHISVDGMDSTNPNIADREDGDHPGVDNVQEFTVQTSNFAAEFGQVSGGLFNFASRSGGNKYHGSAYDYFTNEDLNAGRPYSQLVSGGPIGSFRQKSRQNDFGYTIGGPIRIPHLYDGRDKTFFFVSIERYILNQSPAQTQTVPTERMRGGDFGELLTNKILGTDPLGRNIYQNAIYDPSTARCSNAAFTLATCTSSGGQLVSDPFGYTSPTTQPTNIIPSSRFDGVASKIQAMIPHGAANFVCGPGGACVNNLVVAPPNPVHYEIPAFKVDQVITQNWKMSFSYSQFSSLSASSADGLPLPLSAIRTNYGTSNTFRWNNDYTITPNLLLHVGGGYVRRFQNDGSPPGVSDYNAASGIGLPNTVALGFPRLNGLSNGTYGGVNNTTSGFGPTARNQYWTDTANGIASAVWTHGTHVIKGGVDYKMGMWVVKNQVNVAGAYGFAVNETGLVNNTGNAFYAGGNTGFSYASFLLGLVDNGNIGDAIDNQYHRPTYALYLQDTWRARRNLSIDYGMRWDFTETEREHAYRTSGFNPTVKNVSNTSLYTGAAYNGTPLLGALAFEGFGHAGDCECYFSPKYPYAIGPRLGVAFNPDPRTVFRGGFGITYGAPPVFNYAGSNFNVVSVGINNVTFTKPTVPGLPAYFTPATTLTAGAQYNPSAITDASRNPAYGCCTTISNAPSPEFDHNGGKPPVIYNYTFGVQEQLNKNLYLEIAYVGNRAHWLTSGASGAAGIIQPNALSKARVASFGFDITNPSDAILLSTNYSSLTAAQKTVLASRLPNGGVGFPYAGFPTNQPVAQSLRPFPQYSTIYTEYSPSGKSWYDAMQLKLTQRPWHGLQYLESFTWSKEQDLGEDTGRGNGAIINDVTNVNSNKFLSSTYQPYVSVTSFTYDLPYVNFGHESVLTRQLLKGWTLGGIFRLASGLLLRGPSAVGLAANGGVGASLLRGTFAERVPDQQLFTVNPNSHFNPLVTNATGVLNQNAWAEPAAGQFSATRAYMNDYRWQRQPDEEMNLGKKFSFPIWHEQTASLQIRAEYFNIFNHTYLPQPSTSGYNTHTSSTGSFGNISVQNNLSPYQYRTGQLVARFEF